MSALALEAAFTPDHPDRELARAGWLLISEYLMAFRFFFEGLAKGARK